MRKLPAIFASLLRSIIPKNLRPIGYLIHLTQRKTSCRVLKGPFKGMRYVNASYGSAYIPKLLGIYEKELHASVESLIQGKPSVVIDIGAAEGYYAIGMALRINTAKVVAFEMEPEARNLLSTMAEINSVSNRVEIRGACNCSNLSATLSDHENVVIICDIEGAEMEILDPKLIPELSQVSLLIEMHDFIAPCATQTLIDRFNASHHITQISQEDRSIEEFPWRTMASSILPRSYLRWAVSEWRPVKMSWLSMLPRSKKIAHARYIEQRAL